MRARRGSWIGGIALGALVVPGAVLADETAVGEVTALSGRASAVREGGTPRPLACGDKVYEGESVTTEPGSGAGLLLGNDLLAQVGEGSTLSLGRTGAGTPDATLKRGSVRVIDAREGQAPARLAAGSAAARVAGGDSEAYLLAEKAGGYAMFCEWDAPLAVERGNESRTASPTQCVIAKPEEPLYVANAHEERMPAGPDGCPPGNVAALGPHFPDAADVAAGPPAVAFSAAPNDLPGFAMMPCEDPGAPCSGVIFSEGPPNPGGETPGDGGGFPGTPIP
jgi:hypothetical protein